MAPSSFDLLSWKFCSGAGLVLLSTGISAFSGGFCRRVGGSVLPSFPAALADTLDYAMEL